jgi:hypothetical protein
MAVEINQSATPKKKEMPKCPDLLLWKAQHGNQPFW